MTAIRRATVSDIDSLIQLGQEMSAESPVFRRYTRDEVRQRQVVKALIESPHAIVLIADDATAMMIGYVDQLPWFKEFVAYEEIVFVRKKYRGTPRAMKMLKMFIQWARDKGARDIRMNISTDVAVDSTSEFYKRMGFRVNGNSFLMEI